MLTPVVEARDPVVMKDKAVRVWIACGRNAHVAAAIARADKTITMEDREVLLDYLADLHRIQHS